MRAHELAKRLLDGPNVDVVVRERDDSLFVIKKVIERQIIHPKHDTGTSLYFEFDERHDTNCEPKTGIELW